MPFKKSKTKERSKRYRLEFSRTSLLLWCLGSLFLLAWIFLLGIFVGRGFFPQGIETLSKLRLPIASFQNMVGNKKTDDLDGIKGLDKDPEFEFYDRLSGKKGEVVDRSKLGNKQTGAKIKRGKVLGDEVPEKSQSGFGGSGGQNLLTTGINAKETVGNYTVQVASLESKNKAFRMADRLKKRGYPVYIHEVSINGKTYYRVKCGNFMDRKEAEDFKSLLAKKEKVKGFVSKETTKGSQPELKKEKGEIKSQRATLATKIISTYTVQVASLKSESKAFRMADQLKKNGYPASVHKVDIAGKSYYRVRCGRFNDKKDAADYEKLLARREKIKGFVTKIKGD